MNIFEKSIQELQLNNVLVVLRVAGGQYDGQLLQEMVKEYKLVDLSLPVYRLQVEQNPLGFVQGLELPVYLANLHYTPSLLPVLLASGLPMDKLMASCSQSYYLQESIAKVNADQGSQAADASTAHAAGVPYQYGRHLYCISGGTEVRRAHDRVQRCVGDAVAAAGILHR